MEINLMNWSSILQTKTKPIAKTVHFIPAKANLLLLPAGALSGSVNSVIMTRNRNIEDVWMFADGDTFTGKSWIGKGSTKNISGTRHNGMANFVTVSGSVMSAKAEANFGNAATKGYALPQKYWLYHDR